VALAEQSVSAPQHTPLIYSEIATTSMTTKNFSKYAFRIRPNTVSGARSLAITVNHRTKQRPLGVYFLNPDYSYGHELTHVFAKALGKHGVQYNKLGEQYPKLGSTSFTNYITAINAASPDLLFLGIYAGDFVNFVKQANRTNLLQRVQSARPCDMAELATLKKSAPSGEMCITYAPPPYAIHTKQMKSFIHNFQKQYKALPNDEQTLAYESVQAWAQAVKKAKSFGGTKVSQTLSGLTVHGVASRFTVRPCDHQATLPVYAGTIGKKVSQRWHQKLLTNVQAIPASKTLAPCGNNHGNGGGS
jgi:branched-chain amino acid transport system substrate-binding protein